MHIHCHITYIHALQIMFITKTRPRAKTSKCVIIFMNKVTDPKIAAEYVIVNYNLSIIMCQHYHNFWKSIGNLLLLERWIKHSMIRFQFPLFKFSLYPAMEYSVQHSTAGATIDLTKIDTVLEHSVNGVIQLSEHSFLLCHLHFNKSPSMSSCIKLCQV